MRLCQPYAADRNPGLHCCVPPVLHVKHQLTYPVLHVTSVNLYQFPLFDDQVLLDDRIFWQVLLCSSLVVCCEGKVPNNKVGPE